VDALARGLILAGLAMVVVGVGMLLVGRLGLPRLPGDLVIHRDGVTIFFPLVTCLLLSLVLTILLNLFLGGRR